MLGLHLSYSYLWWTPRGTLIPVPKGIEREYISAPGSRLELLVSRPSFSPSPAILFIHGGMGSAPMWIPYMQYLHSHGVTSYAISLRGHGASSSPSFLRMAFGTSRSELESDLEAAIEVVGQREEGGVVLVGHSAGGGLSQAVLAKGEKGRRVVGLGLLGAIPGFGSLAININWFLLDPWFTIRCFFLHAFHPNSPLSHPKLVRRAFFGRAFPLERVPAFMELMAPYESYSWPFSMMWGFVGAGDVVRGLGLGLEVRVDQVEGVDDDEVVRDTNRTTGIDAAEPEVSSTTSLISDQSEASPSKNSSKNLSSHSPRILVMAGAEDALMTSAITHRTAAWYAAAAGPDEVRMELVPGAGHHLQNDVQWEDGAARLLDWYGGLVG